MQQNKIITGHMAERLNVAIELKRARESVFQVRCSALFELEHRLKIDSVLSDLAELVNFVMNKTE